MVRGRLLFESEDGDLIQLEVEAMSIAWNRLEYFQFKTVKEPKMLRHSPVLIRDGSGPIYFTPRGSLFALDVCDSCGFEAEVNVTAEDLMQDVAKKDGPAPQFCPMCGQRVPLNFLRVLSSTIDEDGSYRKHARSCKLRQTETIRWTGK